MGFPKQRPVPFSWEAVEIILKPQLQLHDDFEFVVMAALIKAVQQA